jgi:signal peptidase complex subunit 3
MMMMWWWWCLLCVTAAAVSLVKLYIDVYASQVSKWFKLTPFTAMRCMVLHYSIALDTLPSVIHKLELKTLKSLKSHGGVDRALLSFDIHADMEPAFHWNVKQLFVYVVASYESESKKVNQVVVWDKILEAIDPKKLIKEENVFVKYALVDQGTELRGKDVTLSLHWDHMPITGFLYMGGQSPDTTTSFTLPAEYQ